MYSIIIFIALFIIGHSITKSIIWSFIIALVFSSTVEAFFIRKYFKTPIMEGMSNRNKKKNKKNNKNKNKKTDKNIKKMLKSRKYPKGKYTFDAKKSYKKTYNTLSDNQIKGLQTDTSDLVKTQEQLMSTLKEMGPVLEQGKSIIGAFDSFFGNGEQKNDLAYMTKRLGLNKKD